MHHPPQRFLYLRETKSWRCEEEGEEREGEGGEEKVHLLTHATAKVPWCISMAKFSLLLSRAQYCCRCALHSGCSLDLCV